MRKIIFVPTWKCNLKCSYCDYSTLESECSNYIVNAFANSFEVDRELTWLEWLEKLERFNPYLLEMTGGEPTLYKDLHKLLNHLPNSSRWAITSNSLNSKMIRKLNFQNCLAWTASYHFKNKEQFIDNLKYIRTQGVNVRVTLVFTPDNDEECMAAAFEMSQYFGINLHPLLKQDFDWNDHLDVWDRFKKFANGRNILFIENIPPKWEPQRFKQCSAGYDYFALMPDGKVLRCYSEITRHQENVVYIDDYNPEKENKECMKCCCFPCDKDIARMTN